MVETIFPQPIAGEVVRIFKEKKVTIYVIKVDESFFIETTSNNMEPIIPGRASDQ